MTHAADVVRRVLVAGVGNIFQGDDGFGVEVAQRLAEAPRPAGVEVADFGIRGVHLAYQLMDGYDALVLVDALARGEPAGTVYVLEPDLDVVRGAAADATEVALPDAHSLDPAAVLSLLATLSAGGPLPVGRVVVVGCEPATVADGIGLSPVVAGAVDSAVRMVHEVLADLGVAAPGESELSESVRRR
jgi:hydrogenase maturation protease